MSSTDSESGFSDANSSGRKHENLHLCFEGLWSEVAKGERRATAREVAAERRLKTLSREAEGERRRGGGGAREAAQGTQGRGIEASTGGFEAEHASDWKRRSDSEHRIRPGTRGRGRDGWRRRPVGRLLAAGGSFGHGGAVKARGSWPGDSYGVVVVDIEWQVAKMRQGEVLIWSLQNQPPKLKSVQTGSASLS